jgi:hypothetical protein
MWAWIAGMAAAADVPARLAEIAPLRSMRATSAPAIPEAGYAKAIAGEVATGVTSAGDGKSRVWGVAVVPVPIDRFWGAINDDQAKPRWTDLAHLELLRGEWCSAKKTVFQYLDVDLFSDRWWVVEQSHNEALARSSGGQVRELGWRSVPDGESLLNDGAREWAARGVQIATTAGAWLLVDLGDGTTLVEYSAYSDPGGIVPAGVLSRFAAGSVVSTIDAMRRLAVDGPACF